MAIDKYIEAFKKTVKNQEFLEYGWIFCNEIEFFKCAVHLGYLDAARTFKGIKNKGNAFKNLAEGIQNYFYKNKISDFDTLHYNLCDKFIEDLKGEGYTPSYGQAQKVVNMAFKYLYCCDGFDRSKFKDCHMALDSFTLNWYIREVLKVDKNIVGKWSKIDGATYKKIQTDIRTHLKGKIVIEEEFIIWPDEILIAAALEFNSTFKKIKDSHYPEHNNESLAEVINETKKLLSDKTTSKNF